MLHVVAVHGSSANISITYGRQAVCYDLTMDEIVQAWKAYTDKLTNWESLIEDVTPKQTHCGPVYEPPSPLPHRTETFAISDIRGVKVAEPHYHINGETEIYFVLQGSGLTVVGGKEIEVNKGSVVITPPNTAHFTIPKNDLVLVVINTPNFKAENVKDIHESDPNLGFDKGQYDRLTKDLT